MRIVFFGTPRIASEILKCLLEHNIDVIAVVTKKDKPLGRSGKLVPPAVKVLAEQKAIPCHQPVKASDPEFVDYLKTLDADLFVVAAFSEIFKEGLLDVPRFGCINVHASLLPKYRGAAPIQRCIMAGEVESGVTIMQMDRGLDTGGMIAVVKTPILPDMTAGELMIELTKLGGSALVDVIKNFNDIEVTPQPAGETFYAKKVSLEDGEVVWNRPAEKVYAQIRGVTPKPGAWCWVEIRGVKKRLKICSARLSSLSGSVGEVVEGPLIIACSSGAIELLEVQVEGKRRMESDELMRGVDNIIF